MLQRGRQPGPIRRPPPPQKKRRQKVDVIGNISSNVSRIVPSPTTMLMKLLQRNNQQSSSTPIEYEEGRYIDGIWHKRGE